MSDFTITRRYYHEMIVYRVTIVEHYPLVRYPVVIVVRKYG